jgi:hypothetical protein|tara:strand:+ start:318 stop:428 length:111 start_codon:yes stop_codon:yes gene_type:complete
MVKRRIEQKKRIAEGSRRREREMLLFCETRRVGEEN